MKNIREGVILLAANKRMYCWVIMNCACLSGRRSLCAVHEQFKLTARGHKGKMVPGVGSDSRRAGNKGAGAIRVAVIAIIRGRRSREASVINNQAKVFDSPVLLRHNVVIG